MSGPRVSHLYQMDRSQLTRLSFAMYELLISIAVLIRRFEFELVDTIWERDVRVVRDCFLSEPMPGSQGVKVRIVKERA